MSLKQQVFNCYRHLLRTRQIIFAGDVEALEKSRLKIRDAFLAQKHLTEPSDIVTQIQIAVETDDFLKQGVVQGAYSYEDQVYKLKINESTKLHDNVPLKDINVIDLNKYQIPDKYK